MAQAHILPIQDRAALAASPSAIQAVTVTTAAAATTAFTFKALGLCEMQNTTYVIFATVQEASTTTIECTVRATTGFTLSHESAALAVDVVVMGAIKRG